MGLFDRSSSTTNLTEQNIQQTDARAYGFSEIGGLALAEVGGDVEIAIDSVDSGLVAAARDLGSGALAVSGDITALALRNNQENAAEAYRTSRLANEGILAATKKAIDSNDASQRAAFGFASDASSDASATFQAALRKQRLQVNAKRLHVVYRLARMRYGARPRRKDRRTNSGRVRLKRHRVRSRIPYSARW